MRNLAIIITLFLFSCSSKKSKWDIKLGTLPTSEMAFQKMFIAQLAGEKPVETTNGETFINSRWHNEEKAMTRAYLKKLILQIGLKPIAHSYAHPNVNFAIDLLIEPQKGTNLYTVLPATKKTNDYVVIGGHYDTGGKDVPGAIDNGSGMALIFSVLRQLKKIPNREKNVIVVFLDQEEEELVGSSAFAKFLKKEQYNIHSVHTYDLIGWDSDNNKEVEIELPSKEIEALYHKHAEQLDIPIYTTSVRSSDHFSFIRNGFNAVGVSQAISKGDNSGKKDSVEDKYALVNFEYLESSTTLAFQVIKDIIDD